MTRKNELETAKNRTPYGTCTQIWSKYRAIFDSVTNHYLMLEFVLKDVPKDGTNEIFEMSLVS